jgi:hypothetical protein
MYLADGIVIANFQVVGLAPGAKPTITSYNASVVKIYNSITRF